MSFFNYIFGSNKDNSFKIGDRVRVKYRGQEGYIIDKNGSLYMVSINNGEIVDSYEAKDIEKCWWYLWIVIKKSNVYI